MNDLYTRKTLSLKLKVSTPTIIRWELKGLPVIRIGGIVRYDLEKVMFWLGNRKTEKELKDYYKGK